MRSTILKLSIGALLLAGSSHEASAAPEDDAIQKAIKKGAAYLKSLHQPGPTYHGGAYGTGTAPLVGLALLEAGVPATDPVLKNITAFVRDNALALTATYNISLTILYLDKLGEAADRPLIQMLGIRLVAGQLQSGGWTYECGVASNAAEIARLKKVFATEARLANKPDAKRLAAPADPKADPKQLAVAVDDDAPKLHPEAVKFAKLINQMGGKGLLARIEGEVGDNSNTQFAMLAVWTARKHGVPCDAAVAAFGNRFRQSQSDDGGWGYTPQGFRRGSTASMTCAGLVAFAVTHGVRENILKNRKGNAVPARANEPAPGDDPAIKAALKCLGAYITLAKGQRPEVALQPARKGKRFQPDNLNTNLYFLWSLERVAVLYGLETIGKHDWYRWGADALVDSQLANGCWNSKEFPGSMPEVNTAFALLFLTRANVARDLTVALKGKVRDPEVAVLRGGGNIPRVDPPAEAIKPEPKVVENPRPQPKADVESPRPEQKVSPPKGVDLVALTRDLVNVADDERRILLEKYRDEKGGAYTDALAAAARRWTGAAQREARDALASRLKRMTNATLQSMLREDNREIRLGAAAACGLKNAKACIPDLIEVLRDADELIVRAAHNSLKSLSGEDFGPGLEASAGEKLKSVLAWRNWWNTQMR